MFAAYLQPILFGGALFCRIILVSRVTGIIEAVGLERVRIALEDGAVVTYAWDADAGSSYDPRFVWEFMDESFRRVLHRNARRCARDRAPHDPLCRVDATWGPTGVMPTGSVRYPNPMA